MKEIINFSDVSFSYNGNRVVENVSFSVKERDFLAIIGPNGGGKTTILKLMMGLLIPDSGKISAFGGSAVAGRKRVGYVPQHLSFDKLFPISVEDVVLMGLLRSYSFTPFYSKAHKRRAFNVMESVDIAPIARRRFGELSGGQRQRVLIARALVGNPEVLLLDEPVASVDPRVEEDIYTALSEMNRKITIVMVSHDIAFVSSYVNRVACVNRNLAIHDTGEISREILRDRYNRDISMLIHKCEL